MVWFSLRVLSNLREAPRSSRGRTHFLPKYWTLKVLEWKRTAPFHWRSFLSSWPLFKSMQTLCELLLACNYTFVRWVHFLRSITLKLATLAPALEADCSIHPQEWSQQGSLKTRLEDCVANLVLQHMHRVYPNDTMVYKSRVHDTVECSPPLLSHGNQPLF